MNLSGASNDFFYCFSHGEATFHLKYNLTFREPVQPAAMKRALSEALRLFPEFAVRPVIRDNRVWMVPNDSEPVVLDDSPDILYYGTKDTNGYMLYFVCRDRELTVYFFHGVTDAVGMTSFLKSALTLYMRELGAAITDETFLASVRTPEHPCLNPDSADMFDPYRLYGKADAIPDYVFRNPGALVLPVKTYPPQTNRVHEFLIDISTAEFITLTKKLGVSFTPLIMDIAAQTAFRNYDTGDDPFIAMLPVNLRPFFGSATAVNFSDGISAPVYREDLTEDVDKRCKKTRDIMKQQMTKANFEKLIADKTAAVDNYLARTDDVLSRVLPAPSGGKSSFSLPVSYPGKLSLGDEIDALLCDAGITGYSRVNSLVIRTFGDKMEFSVLWRSDDDSLPGYLCDELKRWGFTPSLRDAGFIKRDLLMLDRLERI